MVYAHLILPSPVGTLKLVANHVGLTAVLWENDNPLRVPLPATTEDTQHPILQLAAQQLQEYFQRQRTEFTIPLSFIGTPFQQRVWHALCAIPYGHTRTYGQLAQKLGSLGASRAVGTANAKNPISIIAPCHRVIGASGHLTGFAGGLPAKSYLLNLEASVCQPDIFESLNQASRPSGPSVPAA